MKDSKFFENQKLNNLLTRILIEVDNQKASAMYYDGRGHFGSSFSKIRDYSTTLLVDFAIQENTSVIDLKKKITIKLIKENFGSYIKLIFKKFYDSTWLFVFLPFFMLLASLIAFTKYRSQLSFLTLFISVFTLANHSVVYLFGRVQPRYLIYTDFIILIFFFIIFTILLKKK